MNRNGTKKEITAAEFGFCFRVYGMASQFQNSGQCSPFFVTMALYRESPGFALAAASLGFLSP